MKRIVLIILVLNYSLGFSQYGRRDGNRIGISGGITNTTLYTSDFNVKPENGWIGGFSVRGNYYNDWSMIFGMQFTESNFSVETINALLQNEDVKYKLSGAQIRLLLSANLVKNHLSIDFGPVLQVNGKLKIDSSNKNNIIKGTALLANDIIDITKINGNLYIGASAGGKRVRAVVFYQYGLNNIMNNLNRFDDLKIKNNNHDFRGHIGMISGQILFNL
ncbi:PorT family protein [Flavobacterium amniphilum]|uniref:PorT family protein n=1 Tax=Flavobacterium amniphilum TaxID=1834035 RepID=UPI00202A1ADE|nr:PorT family protein [Flavobacterium amniphilum]MCL9804129.1 PorT family protein [Flavobacterium amniphilum]